MRMLSSSTFDIKKKQLGVYLAVMLCAVKIKQSLMEVQTLVD